MFLHNLKYELLTSIRARDLIIWLMIFPLILGTLFKIAFGSIYENDTLFSTIPTAIVEEDGKNEIFRSVIDSVEKSDTPLLKAQTETATVCVSEISRSIGSGFFCAEERLSILM